MGGHLVLQGLSGHLWVCIAGGIADSILWELLPAWVPDPLEASAAHPRVCTLLSGAEGSLILSVPPYTFSASRSLIAGCQDL